MVQQIADHFLTASADCVVQECAALLVPVHEVTSCSVQLLELRTMGRAEQSWVSLPPQARTQA